MLSSVDFQQNSQHDVQRDIDVGDGGRNQRHKEGQQEQKKKWVRLYLIHNNQ